MSRQRIPMQDGTLLVIGWDKAFQTWYAQLYDDHDEDKAPRAVIGYGPDEQTLLQSERPDVAIGDYPIADDNLEQMVTEMIPALMGIQPADRQPNCVYCHQPPWHPNPGCVDHPFDRLKR